ncbi:MAG: carboxylate-amine ligase [Pseudomonadota bacterium]
MTAKEPEFSLGMEEEYLLVDEKTLNVTPAPDAFMKECQDALSTKVSPEFLQCQIEVGTGVCKTVADARADLTNLRRTITGIAKSHGLQAIAASTHPFAAWQQQKFTEKERYRILERDLAGVARRMLICGMHVHVGIEDDDLRIDMMNQIPYFLPHLLALSTSSPFWEGSKTGLRSYRLTVFDNLPRTGLPPEFASFAEYQRSLNTIINTGMIEDATKIWWDLRPSARFPTVEVRICDVCPRLEDALAIAAVIQSLFRLLYNLRANNQRWRQYDRFLIAENRWRAQRYGVSRGLIDFGRQSVVDFPELMNEFIELLEIHAEKLGCLDELRNVRKIVESGTSADRQIRVHEDALSKGANEEEALREVVRSLASEFTEGLDD